MTSFSVPLPSQSLFTNSAVKYNTHITEQEKFMLTNEGFLRTYLSRVPGTLFMPVNVVLGAFVGSPFPITADLMHFIYRSAQVKRCVDFRLQAELGTFSEYYFDNACADQFDAEGYRDFTARVHGQMQLAEIAIYNAVHDITLRGLYLDDLLFPYEFVQMSDPETGMFAVINGPALTMADFDHYPKRVA